MGGKKADTRFTILLRVSDPRHLQAADILNSQGFHGKAQYIVNAVLYYASHKDESKTPRTVRLDERSIEEIMKRLTGEQSITCVNKLDFVPGDQPGDTLLSSGEINFDDALEAIGGDGFSAITEALEMLNQN